MVRQPSPGVKQVEDLRHERWAALLVTLIALAPVVAVICSRAGRPYLPVQDFALIDLRVRDVWSSGLPLVGAYSRFGWNHPGPAMFWLIGLFSGIFGRAAWATQVGAAILQGIAIAASARLGWQRGRFPLTAAVMALTALSYGAAGGRFLLLDPFNPNVAFPFLILFGLQCWSASVGATRQLIWLVLTGSFLVQTHVGYAPFVLAGSAWVVILLLNDLRTGSTYPDLRKHTRWAVAAFGIAWLPAFVEQLEHGREGNLYRVLKYFVAGQGHTIGLWDGAGLLAEEFRVLPPWLGGHEHVAFFSGTAVPASPAWLSVAVGLAVVGLLAVRRSGSSEDGRLLGIAVLFVVVGVAALARLSGELFQYLFLWRVPIALFLILAVLWTTRGAWQSRRLTSMVVTGALVVSAGISAGTLAVDVLRDRPIDPTTHATRDILADLVAHGLPRGTVLIREGGINPLGLEGGVVDALDRQGVKVRVDRSRGVVFGNHRVTAGRDVSTVWYVVEGGQFLSLLSDLPGARVLASTSPLSETQEQELRRGQQQLARQLERIKRPGLIDKLQSSLFPFVVEDVRGIQHHLASRVGRLNRLVETRAPCRCAIVAVAPRNARFLSFWSWRDRQCQGSSAKRGKATRRALRRCRDQGHVVHG